MPRGYSIQSFDGHRLVIQRFVVRGVSAGPAEYAVFRVDPDGVLRVNHDRLDLPGWHRVTKLEAATAKAALAYVAEHRISDADAYVWSEECPA